MTITSPAATAVAHSAIYRGQDGLSTASVRLADRDHDAAILALTRAIDALNEARAALSDD